jgi:hypothetical protein
MPYHHPVPLLMSVCLISAFMAVASLQVDPAGGTIAWAKAWARNAGNGWGSSGSTGAGAGNGGGAGSGGGVGQARCSSGLPSAADAAVAVSEARQQLKSTQAALAAARTNLAAAIAATTRRPLPSPNFA